MEEIEKLKIDLLQAIQQIEADADDCHKQAIEHKEKEDNLNAYLMDCQSLAHALDAKRLRVVHDRYS